MGWTTRMVAAGAVTAAVVTSVALGGVGAEKTEIVSGPVSIPAGYIAFEIGPNGKPRIARYDENDGLVQHIDLDVSNKCLVRNRQQLAALLDIRALGSTDTDVYYVDSGLGFRTTGNCSRGNGRISAGQTMVLTAGAGLSFISPKPFISAKLNIEGKFDADLEYTIDGGDSETEQLKSDTGDNGPDSGAGDNTIVSIKPDKSFTSIKLSPTSADGRGQIALDNGGDSADRAANRTILRLGRTFDHTVDCDENREAFQDGGESESIDGVTFIRSNNKNDGACEPIGLDIDIEPGGETEGGAARDVVFVDPAPESIGGSAQQVRARVKLEWRVQRYDGEALRSPEDINLELERHIEYPDSAPQLVTYCASSDVADDLLNSDPADPGSVIHPADQPWCLLSDTRVLEENEIIQVMILDVGGDPKFF